MYYIASAAAILRPGTSLPDTQSSVPIAQTVWPARAAPWLRARLADPPSGVRDPAAYGPLNASTALA